MTSYQLFSPHIWLAAALAVATAIAVIHATKTLHPPGGATALIAVIGGESVYKLGDLKHHGRSDKAVCVYSQEHYPYWEDILGIKLPVAAFGENLTVSDLKEEDICIGDVFELGTALLQVSQPRQPCRTLAARYGRDDLVKLVADSGRTGFYFRVLKEGIVQKGVRLARNNYILIRTGKLLKHCFCLRPIRSAAGCFEFLK